MAILSEMIYTLMIFKFQCVEFVAHPWNISPYEIKICVTVSLLPPWAGFQGIKNRVSQACSISDDWRRLGLYCTGHKIKA